MKLGQTSSMFLCLAGVVSFFPSGSCRPSDHTNAKLMQTASAVQCSSVQAFGISQLVYLQNKSAQT